MIVVFFTLVEEAGSVKLKPQRLTCPGDCSGRVAVIALGEHDAADQFLDTHLAIYQAGGPELAIQRAIETQANATPQYVALPITFVSMDEHGIHEIVK